MAGPWHGAWPGDWPGDWFGSDGGSDGLRLYPPLVASSSEVYAPTVSGGAPTVLSQGGRWRRRVRPRHFALPPLVPSRSLVFWPIALQNPPRPLRERVEDDAVALMF